ncbi:hypothetical protein TrLO_g2296, partial [Triparma laevis f. longispina]
MSGTDLISLKSNCVNCPSGKYSGSGEYVSPEGNPCTGCMTGKSTFGTDTSDHDSVGDCSDCGVGTFSGIGEACTGCTVGKYNDSPGSETCTGCAAGKSTFGTDTSDHDSVGDCSDCGVGTFSGIGEACTGCAVGKYNDSPGSETCTGCAAGKSTTGSLAENHDSGEDCSNCGVGEYSGIGEACTGCAAGKHLASDATGVESSTCSNCSAGQYSGSASPSCSNCAAGKYLTNAATGVESSACTDCNAGQYSGSASASCSNCATGTYSGTSSATCSNCAAGKRLTNAATDVESSACLICTAGTYSTLPVPSTACTICPAGKYNPDHETSASLHESCTPCGLGTQLVDDGEHAVLHDSAEDCRECNPGFFSNNPEGASSCEACQVGLVSPSGASACSLCPAGYDCSGGTTVMCSPGNYSNGDTAGCEPCQKGYYCPGATDHHMCRPGSYQPDPSQTSCLACPAGKQQEYSGKDECADCPVGHFCPERTVNPIVCGSVALFCPLKSAIVQSADEGYYTTPQDSESTKREGQTICEVGFACNGGIKTACDGGKYTDEDNASVCKTAPAGKKPTANRQDIENCSPGRYSVGGKTECDECEIGKFSSEGAVGCSQCDPGEIPIGNMCTKCAKGKHATFGSSSCDPCDGPGEYSDEGAGYCEKCPQYETFNATTNGCHCQDTFKRVGGICTCKAGETLMGTKCEPCETAKWKAEIGVTSCNLCAHTLKGSITEEV